MQGREAQQGSGEVQEGCRRGAGEVQERCRRGAGEVRRGAMQAQHVTTSDSFIYKHIKALHSFPFFLKWFEVSFGKPSNFCWRGAGKRGAAGVRRGAGGVQERCRRSAGEVQERCRRGQERCHASPTRNHI